MVRIMKEALLNYREKTLKRGQFWLRDDFLDVIPEMQEEFKRNFLIPRTTKTDFSPFRDRFGYELPDEIKEYMSLYWHPCVDGAYDCMQQNEKGYYKFDDSIVLFSVMKNNNESDDDVLFHKYGIIDLTEEWLKSCKEDAESQPELAEFAKEAIDYIPIGWSSYYAYDILFRRSTKKIYLGADSADRFVCEEPIANSLPELINGLYFYDTN